MGRAATLLAFLAALVVYDVVASRLPDLPLWWDVALLAFVLIPAMFLLVLLALPLRTAPQPQKLAYAVVGLAAAAVVLTVADLDVAANFVKFAAVIVAGWWFLEFFENVNWVLLVALLIVPVDIFSVARGPTKQIVEHQPQIFGALSIAFPIPGEHSSAQLGLPDCLFFALFLAATERFQLRTTWTWVAMTLSFGATLAAAVWWNTAGLPALPLLSIALILVNADRLWRARRVGLGAGPRPPG